MYLCNYSQPGFTVLGFNPSDARDHGIANWSLKPLQTQDDVPRNLALVEALGLQLAGMRICRAYAPHVAPASAHIVDTCRLTSEIRVGMTSLFRQGDLPADGVFLEPGEAFMMSASGCPFITAADCSGEHFAVAHAARDSLIDRGAVLGEPSRAHLSVVNAIIHAFKTRDVPVTEIAMCLHFSIPPDAFDHCLSHPTHGHYNRRLGECIDRLWPRCTERKNGSLFLDLESLFMSQAIQSGITCVHAVARLDQHPSFAHTHDGQDRARRNLFIVRRNK